MYGYVYVGVYTHTRLKNFLSSNIHINHREDNDQYKRYICKNKIYINTHMHTHIYTHTLFFAISTTHVTYINEICPSPPPFLPSFFSPLPHALSHC